MAEKPIIVVKIGGSLFGQLEGIAQDIAALQQQYSAIVVHGGSGPTNRLCERLGIKPQFITSPSGYKSRYTNAEVIDAYVMAVAGQMSAAVVLALQKAGVNALGIAGFDGKAVQARQKIVTSVGEDGRQRLLRDDYTGKIERINAGLLRALLSLGYVPVVAALAMGESFQPLNLDGDRLAAMVGAEMKAKALVMLTDVEGFYRNFPEGFAPTLAREELAGAIGIAGAGAHSGGMKKKLLGCAEALDGGVEEVIIGNGKAASPISRLLAGAGTHIRK
jgi:acetylglutamate/LysW-gamma-L-alpha-aminoadipate kinase